jgi:hypothetical protein
MANFADDIWKLEEASRSIAEKSKDVTDIDEMAAIQHIQQAIHSAYVNLRRINSQQQTG